MGGRRGAGWTCASSHWPCRIWRDRRPGCVAIAPVTSGMHIRAAVLGVIRSWRHSKQQFRRPSARYWLLVLWWSASGDGAALQCSPLQTCRSWWHGPGAACFMLLPCLMKVWMPHSWVNGAPTLLKVATRYHSLAVVSNISISGVKNIRPHFYQTRSAWSIDQGSNENHSPVNNFAPTVTKFCVLWEGQALPHDTKFGNCRDKIVDSRMFLRLSLIHGSSWSGLIKLGPGGADCLHECPLAGSRRGWRHAGCQNPRWLGWRVGCLDDACWSGGWACLS